MYIFIPFYTLCISYILILQFYNNTVLSIDIYIFALLCGKNGGGEELNEEKSVLLKNSYFLFSY